MKEWTARSRPERRVLEGRYVRLEPLHPACHGDGLFAVSSVADAQDRFRWLGDEPPKTRAGFQQWLDKAAAGTDPLFFVVINAQTGRIGGRQALMRIDPLHGSIEIGNIYWGPGISRTRLATEAFYLFARYIFDELGYRRFEWKCDNCNAASKSAAQRFGFHFEGVFRQHMVIKGRNRDTAWFSMLDSEWPEIRTATVAWLAPENFGSDGQQVKRLEEIRRLCVADGCRGDAIAESAR